VSGCPSGGPVADENPLESKEERPVSDNRNLYRAILEEPHEDIHRHVFADWCEENGHQWRADLIRWQLAGQPEPDKVPWQEWAANLGYPRVGVQDDCLVNGDVTIHRGFVARVSVATCSRAALSRAVLKNPLRHLWLRGAAPYETEMWEDYDDGSDPEDGPSTPAWMWERGGRDFSPASPHTLPPRVFDRLAVDPEVDLSERYVKHYGSRDAAVLALSDVLVYLGRGYAGLPKLEAVAKAG
jgi:uncharacterized protein (TIGR02996 family)